MLWGLAIMCAVTSMPPLLLLQAFKLQGLLTGQQEELLRILACQHDTRLLKAYETVRRQDVNTLLFFIL
jgi:hypothetical protein